MMATLKLILIWAFGTVMLYAMTAHALLTIAGDS